jgi:UDP-N-acetyl-D-mannosaminuronic acid transferase (WecB/TagA/CpsF family)
MVAVGAAFDVHTGLHTGRSQLSEKRGPAVASRLGQEPMRLWKGISIATHGLFSK